MIASFTTKSPTPANASSGVADESNELPEVTSNVNVESDPVLPTLELPESVTKPVTELLPDVLTTAPVLPTPVPTMVKGSVTVMSPETETAAPLETVVDDRVEPSSPSAVALEIATTPADTVVEPV
jgi:hypothetical protein